MQPQNFDIEVGMAVHGATGESIGSVTEVAGFGSTRIKHATDLHAASVTQAHTGTGYFKVSQAGASDMCVPFVGIQDVDPAHGVTLTTAVEAEMRRRAIVLAPEHVAGAREIGRWKLPQSRRWHVWRPRTWMFWRQRGL